MKIDLTSLEAFVVAVVRHNQQTKTLEITKRCRLGRLEITFNWRSRKNLWGRFGGGWNWELGFQASTTTIIINLLVFSLRFYWGKRKDG